jgi:outer membrane protein TolC
MKKTLFALAAVAAASVALTLRAESDAPLPAQLDLRSALRYALDHNYTIQQAREQVRQQEGVVVEVTGQAIPNVSASGTYQRNDPAISQSFPPSNRLWEAQVKASQVVFNPGVPAAIRGARVTRDAARDQLQAVVDAALLDVRTKFDTVLLDREKVRVQEENVELLQRQLTDTRNQFQAGAVSNFEVLRAEVSLANAQPDLISARNDYRVSIEQLRQSLGLPSGPNGAAILPEVVGSLDVVPAQFSEDAALASARAHRPELVRLAHLTEAQEESVKNARSNYYPNASLVGQYEWTGFGYTGAASTYGIAAAAQANGWLVGLEANWSIFDGRSTQGRVRQARSVLEQDRIAQSAEELAIDVEVRQDYSAFEQAQELVDATRKTVEQAREALRLANERFHVGSATQLDVLTSQVSLTQARTNQLQANFNYLVAYATLRKAMGLGDDLAIGG